MRSESNGVEPTCLSQLVQGEQVSIHIVCIVGVGWVVLEVPLCRGLHVLGWPPLWLALIIHHVQPHNLHTSMLSLQGGRAAASNAVGIDVFVAAQALPHTLETAVPLMSITAIGHSFMHT
jgi:hypothetical protein